MDHRYQNRPRNSNSINLSDLRDENTIYLEKTPTKQPCSTNTKENEFFHPSEITARSTMMQKKLGGSPSKKIESRTYTKSIDDILATSYSEDAVNFYRNSLSSLPRTADMSRASSSSFNSRHSALPETKQKKQFWDISAAAPLEFSQIAHKSFYSESFLPAEQMEEKMKQDEIDWENAEAPIPFYAIKNSTNDAMWGVSDPTNRSMGQFFDQKNSTIRDIYPNKNSPKKKPNRAPLIDLTNPEAEPLYVQPAEKSNKRFNLDNMARAIKNLDSASLFVNKIVTKSPKKKAEKEVVEFEYTIPNLEGMDGEDNLDYHLFSLLGKEYDRNYAFGKRRGPEAELKNQENSVKQQILGSKKTNTAIAEVTPKSTGESLKRARSPVPPVQLRLNPPIPAPRNLTPEKPTKEHTFKTPPAQTGHSKSSNSTSSRTYYTAQSLALPSSSSPKLSLPNYGLHQSTVLSSPTNSVKSCSQNSQAQAFAAPIKRTVSELSAGSSRSDFDDDDTIPLRLSTKTLSWETVKLRKVSEKSFTVKNTSIRKQSLKISIEGSGFQLYSTELRGGFALSPSEVRSICLEFCPTRIGAARGELILETSHGVVRKVALFAYGGHVSLSIEGIHKGLYGPKFLTMGSMNQLTQHRRLSETMIIKNSGNLPAFATLVVDHAMRRDFLIAPNAVSVSPKQIRIEPGSNVQVNVEFKPKREQLRHLLNQKNAEVSSVGELFMMFGDEATRLRLLKYANEIEPPILKMLPPEFPNETAIKRELVNFDDGLKHAKLTSLRDQLKNFSFDVIVNRSLDETHLICPDWTITEEDYQSTFQSFAESEVAPSPPPLPYIEVEPKSLYFSQFFDDLKTPKTLKIRSLTSCNDIFVEISSSIPDMVTMHPTSASISPGDVLNVRIYGNFYPKVGQKCIIYVTLENSRVAIPLNFIVDKNKCY